ncbi:MAG: ABC-F family ATP-binding cassette domain-containing protein [Chloroflexi bacterium]|nr:ABC-F family ATP-binding cassette domain-containing protein [Chloroflexota bacterium]
MEEGAEVAPYLCVAVNAMSIISARQLGKYYGAQDVFQGLDLDIARGDKIALVGPNGAGKTTLLRILLGLEEPSQGSVTRARGLRMGYLPQRAEFSSERALYDEMLDVFEPLRRQGQALLELAQRIAAAEDPTDLLERYAIAEQRFELEGGYEYELKIRRVLGGLGFSEEMYRWPIGVLSGGQVTRALLAKLLLQEPDLLVLDEPTNYLDLGALEWLEAYLQDWRETLLVVSHDRYFLDRVVSRVWELNFGRLETYRGNYSRYVQQREERRLRLEREYEAQQELIAKTEDFVRRYKAGQRTREAQGREKRLERLERLEAPRDDKPMRLRMTTNIRAGDRVLFSEGALIGYKARPGALTGQDGEPQEYPLFDTGEFLIRRGQRIALLGPNGSGKTTFLRTILGEIEPLRGEIRIGASVRIGYLPQTQEWLDKSRTVLEQIMALGDLDIGEARSFLGRFLFSGDEVFKSIGDLSGGEQARVALAILSLEDTNLLLLDEPTTHLDIRSQEVLQEVLCGFNGTILFISHDRYLIDALATHVWHLRDGRMLQYEGNYTAFLEARQRELAEAQDGRAAQDTSVSRPDREQQREARRLKRRIEELEQEIERLENRLGVIPELINLASSVQNVAQVEALGIEYQELREALADRLAEWEALLSCEAS